MPYSDINGAKLYYEDTGSGECIVFCHSLLFSLRMFDHQVQRLKDHYRCFSFDFRGQGKSETTEEGYDMDSLASDAVEMIRQHQCSPCHFVGFSMGGFVGLRVALQHPELIRSLILIDTAADEEPKSSMPKYQLLAFFGKHLGLRIVKANVMRTMFGSAFLNDPQRRDLKQEWGNRFTSNDKEGVFKAIDGVLQRESIADSIGAIEKPTLILVGEKDQATPPARSEQMHRLIQNSILKTIPLAGHMSPVEEPEIVSDHIESFLTDHSSE